MQLHRDATALPSQGRALDCHRPARVRRRAADGYWRRWRRAPETQRQLHPHCLWIAVTSPALPVRVRSKSTLSPTLAASLIAGPALHAILIAGHLASGVGPWIGRASGREMVCTDGSIPGVAGPLKKKH